MYQKLSLIIPFLFTILVGCSFGSQSTDTIQGESFSSKQQAIEHFIDKENIKGHVVLVETMEDEEILVAEYNKNEYVLGELNRKKEEHIAYAITGVHSLRGVIGMGWSFTTIAENDYTINFMNEKHANSMQFPDRKYYYAIGKSEENTEPLTITSNAIVSVEVIQ